MFEHNSAADENSVRARPDADKKLEAMRAKAAREAFIAYHLDCTTLLERVVDFLDRYNPRPCAH